MLQIEIFPENVALITRTLPSKDGKPGRSFNEQIAYAHLGGKFPVEMKLSVQDGQLPYGVGIYSVDASSFAINNYGGLELKRFGLKIKPYELDI
ncbi:Putative helix-destabilizing protein (RstB1-phage) [Moritella viscosa]|uniref:single-stranded DNA-binding protein n=1 Tax=Moritella viscosa TaxID=80854 RepID=UPI000910C673|nr:single-stranded DNA-binding protein [Moritella viscosa]SHO23580.1 Putative helix-destabilizing protein (RstB1-phage) [Moritella viscosa]